MYFQEVSPHTEQTVTTTKKLDVSTESQTLFSNKDALVFQFKDQSHMPPDFHRMKVIDEDLVNAVEAVKWINKEYAMQIIADTLSEYMKSLIECLNSKNVNVNQFGIVAVAPKIYFEGVKKKTIKRTLKDTFRESKHISTIGSVFESDFTLHEIKFVDKFSCHVLNGSCEGNLISFFKSFDQTKELPKEDSTFKIKGKVKRHGENFITKFPENDFKLRKDRLTKLNNYSNIKTMSIYCKLFGEKNVRSQICYNGKRPRSRRLGINY